MQNWINPIRLRHKLSTYLKKCEEPTVLALSEIRSAIVFLDVCENSWKEARSTMQSFFHENEIKSSFYFVDRTDYKKKELPKSNIEQTLYLDDLNFSSNKASTFIPMLVEQFPDIIISLVNDSDNNFEYIIKCCSAKCKIGRVEPDEGVFSVLCSDPEGAKFSQLVAWETVKKYLLNCL